MEKQQRPELINIKAEDRPSKFYIIRDGKKIILTHGEVLEATKSLLHRMGYDSLQYFSDVYEKDLGKDMARITEENMVHSTLNAIPLDIMNLANTAIGGENAPSVEYLLGLKK